ncbi:MAG: hypothetical protein AVDCRST_MAG72-1623 [uncultured Nocardioidaceae bacterium]|uniref:Uncharacterized protein n=1 Tax=uncultured Nocardioidaceae bacterium TaxID=253824 RepID=A0A6J4MC15_9ACTN|nr:MAG: hypothetical protein AVDCRST_MAG72-1623 [uncultured Nocardioidaceae bacterium]
MWARLLSTRTLASIVYVLLAIIALLLVVQGFAD